MNTRALICPVSSERINEKVVRANAFYTILVMVTGIWFQSLPLLLFLAVDFFIRAFVQSQVSPIAFISRKSINMLGLGNKAIDKAPKIFAARLGFVMTLLVAIFVMSGWTLASLTVAGILILFAALELTIGFCAGCYIYTYFVYPLMGKK